MKTMDETVTHTHKLLLAERIYLTISTLILDSVLQVSREQISGFIMKEGFSDIEKVISAIETKEPSSPMFLQLDVDMKENILNGVVATSNSGVLKRITKQPLKLRNMSNVNHCKESVCKAKDNEGSKDVFRPDLSYNSAYTPTVTLPKVFNLHDKPPRHDSQGSLQKNAEQRIIRETGRYLNLTYLNSNCSEMKRSTAVLLILHEHEERNASIKGGSKVEDDDSPELLLMSNCREDCKYVMNHFHAALGRNRRKNYKTKIIHRNEDGTFTETVQNIR